MDKETEIKVNDMLQALALQRNQAMDQIVNLAAELAKVQRELASLQESSKGDRNDSNVAD